MTSVVVFHPNEHLRPTPDASEQVGVVPFRGQSYHRDRGCTNPRGRDVWDRCCPRCDWGAFICAVCGGAEGELPTDCPRAVMDEGQRDAVMGGHADYILAQGGWVSSQSTRRPLPVCQEVV